MTPHNLKDSMMPTKFCSKCDKEKLLTDFVEDARFTDKYKNICKECTSAQITWYSQNKELSKMRAKKYREEHLEWAKMVDAKHHSRYNWREKFPDKAKDLAVKTARNRRFKNHGLTKELYDAMLAAQSGLCAVCDEVPKTSSVRAGANKYDDFVVDHDHVTGKVRGLVCTNCNVALGMIRDNPETARKLAKYLESHFSPLNCGLEVLVDVQHSPSGAEQLIFTLQEGEC